MRHKLFWVNGVVALALVCAPYAARADECDPNDPTMLKPDLIVLPPSHDRVLLSGGDRQLAFSTTVANVGDGPLILHGHTVDTPDGQKTQASQEIFRQSGVSCTRVAGYFVYHPTHHHFHFENFSSYVLRANDPNTGTILTTASKTSFCLLDVGRVSGYNTDPQIVPDCLDAEGTEGISVGFADIYDSYLPGQQINLDADPAHPIPAGTYYLINTANPDGVLWEKDLTNNTGFVTVRVPAPKPLRSAADPHTPHTPQGTNGSRPEHGGVARHPSVVNQPSPPHTP
jgi:hypothetical protein